MSDEALKLDNQLCFSIYATSRLLTRAYKPMLDKLGITYPQYLVLLVLWEQDAQAVNTIAKRLHLNTNTITPLLKRMKELDLIERTPCKEDERRVIIQLTPKGQNLKTEAFCVPQGLFDQVKQTDLNPEQLHGLKTQLDKLLQILS